MLDPVPAVFEAVLFIVQVLLTTLFNSAPEVPFANTVLETPTE